MDITTLRVAFSVVAGVLMVLFYFGAYRPTGAPFSGWWTLALVLFSLGSACYLTNGTFLQVVLNPLGNGLAVAGTEAAWCGARSLRSRPMPWPVLPIMPVLAVAAGLLGHPSTDTWSGGLVLLVLMTAALALTTAELVAAGRSLGEPGRSPSAVALILVRALAAVSLLGAIFYAGRSVAFAAVGSHGDAFTTWFGSGPTTLLLLVQLVTVSFSMSSLSTYQQLDDLRHRAVYDQLTGLLRPQEFRAKATEELPRMAGSGELAVLAMADLDHFKQVNDELGHAAGDGVLRAFGQATLDTLGPQAVCGRVGGEEFALLFPALSLEHGERVLATLTAAFQQAVGLADGRIPTVSMGMVEAVPGTPVAELLERADIALYGAKSLGRSRVVRG